VRDKVLNIPQAIKIVEDLFFHTSNKLYGLNLTLKPMSKATKSLAFRTRPSVSTDLETLTSFLNEHSPIKFLRLQWVDYTASPRLRIIPIKRALTMLQNQTSLNIGITKACLELLQNDTIISEGSATGEYKLHAVFSSLKPGPSEGYAVVQGEFREDDGSAAALCPRSVLRRTLLESKLHGLEFLMGFEIEIVFLTRSPGKNGKSQFITIPDSGGHAWSSPRALHDSNILKMVEEIYDTLSKAGIYLEQWHPESSSGQYEFVLPPLPPLEAVDTLILAREIIYNVAARYSIRATLHPKPFPMMAGTASHVHMSISSSNGEKVYESFYAGILAHLRAICAFTYSNAVSYERVVDGCWAGGTWVTWGSQNRETPLRKVSGSHWELKCLDGLANVYLAIAAVISAGVEGVVAGDTLDWKDCEKDPASLNEDERKKLGIEEKLPTTLDEALEELVEDGGLGEMLGKEVVARYIAVKRAEADLLNRMESDDRRDWIIERY
jgi:glutamine synthetase